MGNKPLWKIKAIDFFFSFVRNKNIPWKENRAYFWKFKQSEDLKRFEFSMLPELKVHILKIEYLLMNLILEMKIIAQTEKELCIGC